MNHPSHVPLNPECILLTPASCYRQLDSTQTAPEDCNDDLFFKSQVSLADTC